MNLSEALSFWVTENGYRTIQTLFSRNTHQGANKYALTHMLERNTLKNSEMLKIGKRAIKIIQNSMIPGNKREIYFRGDDELIPQTHIREGFFSVTRDFEKASEYGKVYKVILEKEVPRLSIELEGDEILVMNEMKYTMTDDVIYVSIPSASNESIPYLGNLYNSRKKARQMKQSSELNTLVNDLYCYSFEEPDEFGIYEGKCDEAIRRKFEVLSFNDRLQKLRDRLNDMTNCDDFLESMQFILHVDISKLKGLAKEIMSGGKRRKNTIYKKIRKTLKQKKITRV